MGMTVDFVDAAISLLSRSFPSNEISHRRLGQFLRHGPVATSSVPKGPARAVQPEKELRSPRPLHHATVAAYESAASPGSSRSLLPPTILQHGSSRSPLQHGSSRRMKLPQPRVLPGFACIILGPRSGNETEVVGQKSFSAKLCCVGGKVRFSRAEPQHGKLPRLCIATMKPCL